MSSVHSRKEPQPARRRDGGEQARGAARNVHAVPRPPRTRRSSGRSRAPENVLGIRELETEAAMQELSQVLNPEEQFPIRETPLLTAASVIGKIIGSA